MKKINWNTVKQKTVRIFENIFMYSLLLFVIFLLLYFLTDNRHQMSSYNKTEKYKSEFYEKVDILISKDDSTAIEKKTIKKIFNSIDRKSKGRLFEYGYINVLEDYSIYLLSKSKKINTVSFNKINLIIDEELKAEPYNQLKDEQRRILLNLKKSLIDGNKPTGIYNLDELNDILRTENEYQKKLEYQNSWSIPLAIFGIIVSLFFGVLNIKEYIEKLRKNK